MVGYSHHCIIYGKNMVILSQMKKKAYLVHTINASRISVLSKHYYTWLCGTYRG